MQTVLTIQCMDCHKYLGEKDGGGVEGITSTLCKPCWKKRFPGEPYPEEYPERFIKNGYIAELLKARRTFTCTVCPEPIAAGSKYYNITIGGGGLGSLKYPERCHDHCLEEFLKEKR